MVPAQIVIFGATGDLTARKLIPALVDIARLGLVRFPVQVLGVGRRAITTEQWQVELEKFLSPEQRSIWPELAPNMHYIDIGESTSADFAALKTKMDDLAGPFINTVGRLYYLALKPSLFLPTVDQLAEHGMLASDELRIEGWRRVVVEKPFGTDLPSAQWLNIGLRKHLRENQLYRIDHYLGKETVQNILAFRFENAIFEPIWTREHIEHVEISVCEQVGMESGRGGYYETAGALRDMVQNHLMQLLCLVAMEAPIGLDADAVRAEKIKVLRALEPYRDPKDVWDNVVRAQYGAGDQSQRGYLDEDGVAKASQTETYVAIRARIHNWRWNGVPFLLRSGKQLAKRYTDITLHFRKPPADLFAGPGGIARGLKPNGLTFRIQPDEGIRIKFLVKQPGHGHVLREASLGFDYRALFTSDSPPPYQRLLLDAINGNATLFIHGDETEAAWRFADSIRSGWSAPGAPACWRYPAGSMGPVEADALLRGTDGGSWGQGD
ncbi:MAG: glucose-6-phosphate dehydrogenase [Myxococcales bacterium]|nr:glucose-6-phosphate dehydrogenase [Myxococcales bacterium]